MGGTPAPDRLPTPEENVKIQAARIKAAAAFQAGTGTNAQFVSGPLDITTPPPPPNLADEVVRKARLAARQRDLASGGIGSTFMTGPLGDTTAPATSRPGL